MTWYASQIMTRGESNVVSTIKLNALFNKHAYRVTSPIRHDWYTPEVAHDVPEDGLAFIRHICESQVSMFGALNRWTDGPQIHRHQGQ